MIVIVIRFEFIREFNLLNISNSQSAVKFGTKRKDLTIKGVLQRAGLIPGEQTMLVLDIHNPNRVSIKRIEVCFIQRYEIEQCRRRLELVRLTIPEFTNVRDQHLEATCPLIIPLGIPPSFSYRSKGTRSAAHVDLHYDLKLESKPEDFLQILICKYQFIIGTDSADRSNYDTISSTLLNTLSMVALDFNDDDIPPPPYESVSYNDVSS